MSPVRRFIITAQCPRCGRSHRKTVSGFGTIYISCPCGHRIRVQVTR